MNFLTPKREYPAHTIAFEYRRSQPIVHCDSCNLTRWVRSVNRLGIDGGGPWVVIASWGRFGPEIWAVQAGWIGVYNVWRSV